jgi:hypothetical protein
MPQCSRCRHLTLRNQPAGVVKLGMVRCSRGPLWIFRSPTKPHDCAKYAEVPTEDMPARLAFEKAKQ